MAYIPKEPPNIEDAESVRLWALEEFRAISRELTAAEYTEGLWTPTLTFVTPGDLAVSYAVRVGRYTRMGRQVAAQFFVQSSSFTHTTAAGNLLLTGLPFPCESEANARYEGWMIFGGITIAGYTQFTMRLVEGTSQLDILGAGSGLGITIITAANVPTGGTVVLNGMVIYRAFR